MKRQPKKGSCQRWTNDGQRGKSFAKPGPKGRSRKPTRLGDVLKDTLRDCPLKIDMDLFPIWTQWADLVGPVIAQHARPEAIRGSLLLINVTSTPWLQELQFLKNDIISKLNTALGKESIKDIRFQIGPVASAER